MLSIRAMVMNPDVLVAMNEPSLRKFYKSVPAGGWILYNGDAFPPIANRMIFMLLACPFTRVADELGDARACNMVMLARCWRSPEFARRKY